MKRHSVTIPGPTRTPVAFPGVYVLTCTATGQTYVGRSMDLVSRLGWHCTSLVRGDHPCPELQRAYDRHGPGAFNYEVLDSLPASVERGHARVWTCDRERAWTRRIDPTLGKLKYDAANDRYVKDGNQ